VDLVFQGINDVTALLTARHTLGNSVDFSTLLGIFQKNAMVAFTEYKRATWRRLKDPH
jgi:hypothetical protein